MDKKETINKILVQSWELIKHFGFGKLSEDQWREITGNVWDEVLKDTSGAEYYFGKDIMMAVLNYYDRKEH